MLEARVGFEPNVFAWPINGAGAHHPVLEQSRLGLEKVDRPPGVAKERELAFPQAQAQRSSVEGDGQAMLARLPAEAQVFQRKTAPPFSRQRVDHEEGLAVVRELAEQVGLACRHMAVHVPPQRGRNLALQVIMIAPALPVQSQPQILVGPWVGGGWRPQHTGRVD